MTRAGAAVPMEERDILAPVDAALKLFAVDAATQTASQAHGESSAESG